MMIENIKWTEDLPTVTAFNTLRGNVRPHDTYSDFNICNYTGDNPLHIEGCRRNLCSLLQIEQQHLIMPRQTHSQRVAIVDAHNIGHPHFDDTDALVTSLRGIAIGINTADCVPLLLADPSAGVIAAAHAGWKGTKMRIASRTVEAMIQLGANASNIFAAFGPSICQSCFEVGDEVVEQFAEAGFCIHNITTHHSQTGKAHIDLLAANRIALIESGLNPEHITPTNPCTRCNHQRYFSARRLGINSGRIFSGIMLKQ